MSLAYAQSIYMLPISLFGMAVSAAELPAMSRVSGSEEEISAHLRKRIDAGLKQISFFIVPSIAAFLALGDVIVGALYQTGEFSHQNALSVWAVLAGSTIGLLATTLGRLYSSAFYSLKDTRTPLRFAILRVSLTISLGYLCGLRLPVWLGLPMDLGTVGLTASAGIAGWVEFLFLRKYLNRRIGQTGVQISFMAKLWASAILSAGLGFALKHIIVHFHPVISAVLILGPYGVSYFLMTSILNVEESKRFFKKLLRRK
jgi:putative peptidoglycan lipid II flippase